MAVITVRTRIAAPPEICFDMARDVELHCRSTSHTRERVVNAPRKCLELDDCVTFEAVHFGIRQQFTARVTEMERPHFFTDEMVKGAFRRMRHAHRFLPAADGTLMVDTIEFAAPLGWLGAVVDVMVLKRYLRRFLRRRNRVLKHIAETQPHRNAGTESA